MHLALRPVLFLLTLFASIIPIKSFSHEDDSAEIVLRKADIFIYTNTVTRTIHFKLVSPCYFLPNILGENHTDISPGVTNICEEVFAQEVYAQLNNVCTKSKADIQDLIKSHDIEDSKESFFVFEELISSYQPLPRQRCPEKPCRETLDAYLQRHFSSKQRDIFLEQCLLDEREIPSVKISVTNNTSQISSYLKKYNLDSILDEDESWKVYRLFSHILEYGKLLAQIKADWYEGGDAERVIDLFKLRSGSRTIEREQNTFSNCVRTNKTGIYHINLKQKKIDKACGAVSVDAFKSWESLPHAKCIREYVGPNLILYNHTSSCYKSLDEAPWSRFINMTCTEKGDINKLYKWTYRTCIQSDEEIYPIVQVKSENSSGRIYCYGTDIKHVHYNITVPCPRRPMHFSELEDFSIDINIMGLGPITKDNQQLLLLLFIIAMIVLSAVLCTALSFCMRSRFYKKMHIYQVPPRVNAGILEQPWTETRLRGPSCFSDEHLEMGLRANHYPSFV